MCTITIPFTMEKVKLRLMKLTRRSDMIMGNLDRKTNSPNSGWFFTNVVSVGSVLRWSLLRPCCTRGTGRSPGVGLGGASEPQNTGRLHFAALWLLLIIYAASAAPLPTLVIVAHMCCTAKRAKGARTATVEYRHYSPGTASRGPGEPGQSYREPQSIRPE